MNKFPIYLIKLSWNIIFCFKKLPKLNGNIWINKWVWISLKLERQTQTIGSICNFNPIRKIFNCVLNCVSFSRFFFTKINCTCFYAAKRLKLILIFFYCLMKSVLNNITADLGFEYFQMDFGEKFRLNFIFRFNFAFSFNSYEVRNLAQATIFVIYTTAPHPIQYCMSVTL